MSSTFLVVGSASAWAITAKIFVLGTRVIAFIIGSVFLYCVFFITQAQELKIQNWLIELWTEVEKKNESTRDRLLAFFTQTFELANKLLDRLLGPRLFSPRTILISAVLSCASFLLFTSIGVHVISDSAGTRITGLGFADILMFVLCAIPTVAGLLPLWKDRRWATIPALIFLGLVLMIPFIGLAPTDYKETFEEVVESSPTDFVYGDLYLLSGIIIDIVVLTFNIPRPRISLDTEL